MKRGLFHKYIVAFASIFLIPLIILSFYLHYIMFENLEEDILNYNESVINQLENDFVNIHRVLMETGNTINFSKALSRDMNTSEGKTAMVQTLTEQKEKNSYISKAYFIYNQGEHCFSMFGVYSLEELLQKQMALTEEDGEQFLQMLSEVKEPSYKSIKKLII